MTEQKRAFNPDQAALEATHAIRSEGEILDGHTFARVQEIIADTIREALSHAEGEAPAAYMYRFADPISGHPVWRFDPGSWNGQKPQESKPLYTHPAPQVASQGRWAPDWTEDDALSILHDDGDGPFSDEDVAQMMRLLHGPINAAISNYSVAGAPQVAVPEKYQQAAERYITRACRNAVEKLNELAPHMQWDSGDSTAEIYIRRLRAIAAPTAPAGETDGGDICEQVELPHVLAWADGVLGDMWTEYADRITDEEARVAQAVWAAHTKEQPVSDPDDPIPTILHCPECKALHVDEGEWATRPHKTHQCQKCGHEWRPYSVPTVGIPAPDEREIAVIRQLSETARNSDYEVEVMHDDYENITRFETDIAEHIADWLDKQAEDRLRAGKEGEPS